MLLELLARFNEHPAQELLGEIENIYNKNARKCLYCKNSIFYYDTQLNLYRSKLFYSGKSHLSTKQIGEETFGLQICEKCLTEKFPQYATKNKKRVFNMMSEITAYAYGIPDITYEKKKRELVSRTLENFVGKFGLEVGTGKWNAYRAKQSASNTFAYKKEKHGWDEAAFRDYNKSRAVTLANLIAKHGEELGYVKWDSYVEKQRITKSKDFVVKKYGIAYWQELCSKKSLVLENFIRVHGKEEGRIQYHKYLTSKAGGYSKASQLYFNQLSTKLEDRVGTTIKSFYKTKNAEYYINTSGGCYFIDYYLSEYKIAVEFNGDFWHCNPKKYQPDYIHPIIHKQASEIWRDDEARVSIFTQKGIKVIVVWESNAADTIEVVAETIVNLITNQYELPV